MIKAVIFNLDGTLIDSSDAHANAWLEAFRLEKMNFSISRIRRLIGMSKNQIIETLVAAPASSKISLKLIDRQRQVFVRDHLTKIRPLPGSRELILRLRSEGIKIFATTLEDENTTNILLKRTRIIDLVDFVITPNASIHFDDILGLSLKTLRNICMSTTDAVVVGGTPYEIEAARKVGLTAIGLLCGGWDPQALRGIRAVYRDPADLLKSFDGSIFSKKHPHPCYIPFPLN